MKQRERKTMAMVSRDSSSLSQQQDPDLLLFQQINSSPRNTLLFRGPSRSVSVNGVKTSSAVGIGNALNTSSSSLSLSSTTDRSYSNRSCSNRSTIMNSNGNNNNANNNSSRHSRTVFRPMTSATPTSSSERRMSVGSIDMMRGRRLMRVASRRAGQETTSPPRACTSTPCLRQQLLPRHASPFHPYRQGGSTSNSNSNGGSPHLPARNAEFAMPVNPRKLIPAIPASNSGVGANFAASNGDNSSSSHSARTVSSHATSGTASKSGFNIARIAQRSDSRAVKRAIAAVAESCQQQQAATTTTTNVLPPIQELEDLSRWAQDSFYKVVMVKNDMLAIAVSTMKAFPVNQPIVQALCCDIIHQLCHETHDASNKNKETLEKLGGTRQIISALRTYSHSAAVQTAACAVLRTLDMPSVAQSLPADIVIAADNLMLNSNDEDDYLTTLPGDDNIISIHERHHEIEASAAATAAIDPVIEQT